jgi:hypothetical protein
VREREGQLSRSEAALLQLQRHNEGIVRVVKQFIAGVTCMALVTACAMGGAKRSSSTPVASEASPAGASPSPLGDDPRAEIERRYADVEKQRDAMQLPEPQISSPLAPTGANPMTSQPKSTDQTCKPAKNDTCTQSCELSDSICENAQRICDLAAEMKSEWAYDKCAKAKSTCGCGSSFSV